MHYFTDFRLDKAADITMLGLSILFLVWFCRAGFNAERHGYPSGAASAISRTLADSLPAMDSIAAPGGQDHGGRGHIPE